MFHIVKLIYMFHIAIIYTCYILLKLYKYLRLWKLYTCFIRGLGLIPAYANPTDTNLFAHACFILYY